MNKSSIHKSFSFFDKFINITKRILHPQLANNYRSVQFLKQNTFLLVSGLFSDLIHYKNRIQIGKNNWGLETYRKSSEK